MSRSGTPVETGLDVLDSSFSRQHTHLVRPILNEINAMLGDQVPKSQRYYDTAVMGVVAQELADRPRNGQLSSNLLRPKKFSQMCRALAASMPSSYFKSGGLNIYGFFEGLLEFLRTPPAPGAENVNQAPPDSNIEGGVLRESEMAAPRASIEQDVISINSESSEDSSSESDSSQKSDDDTTAVPCRSTKGKQRAFSNPGEDEVSSPSESHPSPTPPRRTIMKKKYPVAGIDQKVFKRERTDAGTTTTNHTKKRVRDSGLDCDLPRAKPILDTTEPADERDNSPEDPQKPDEPIPAQAAPEEAQCLQARK